jgi:hypothetical protein
MVFLVQFPFKKTRWTLVFFLSSSNINRGKAFTVLSKKDEEDLGRHDEDHKLDFAC